MVNIWGGLGVGWTHGPDHPCLTGSPTGVWAARTGISAGGRTDWARHRCRPQPTDRFRLFLVGVAMMVAVTTH